MLEDGVIVESTSPWAAPILFVPKPGGEWRPCVDYRALNKITTPDPYTMPRVDDLLDKIGNSKFISTLDLTKGYWQVPTHRPRRHL